MKAITIFWSTVLLAISLSGCSQTESGGTAGNGAKTGAGTPTSTETKTGVISDSMCGPNHAGMLKTGSMGEDDVSCTLKCNEAGSSFVLVDGQSGKIYRLSDQEKPRAFAGKKVTVNGQIDEAKRFITVAGI